MDGSGLVGVRNPIDMRTAVVPSLRSVSKFAPSGMPVRASSAR